MVKQNTSWFKVKFSMIINLFAEFWLEFKGAIIQYKTAKLFLLFLLVVV